MPIFCQKKLNYIFKNSKLKRLLFVKKVILLKRGVSIDPTAPYKVYYVGFRPFTSPPIYNALG